MPLTKPTPTKPQQNHSWDDDDDDDLDAADQHQDENPAAAKDTAASVCKTRR